MERESYTIMEEVSERRKVTRTKPAVANFENINGSQ